MSQFFSQSLTQDMRLEQRLTPQLIQSMAILQKPVADLETAINDALESNAALEVTEPEPTETPDPHNETPVERPTPENESFARLDRFSRDYDFDGSEKPPFSSRRAVVRDDRDPKMAAIANAPGRDANLHDYLLSQWSLLEIDAETRLAGEVLIGQLEFDGYLRVSLQEITENTRKPVNVEALESALKLVQRLEPRGVGAQNAVDCLLLQVDSLPGDNCMERRLSSTTSLTFRITACPRWPRPPATPLKKSKKRSKRCGRR